MTKQGKIILVTGATGRQGGAVARHLLKNQWTVRALTRDPSQPAAKELARLGATVAQGDLNEADSVRRALEGCYGVFSVQEVMKQGIEGEVRQGRLLADLARQANIEHFVYASVAAANRETGIPHFQSKWEIENHLRSTRLACTILRPVFFMENFNIPAIRDSLLHGTLSLPLKPDKPLQLIAVTDIGAVAAIVFGDPGRYLGQELDLAGDAVSMRQAAIHFSNILGKAVKYVPSSLEQMEKESPDFAKMYRWFNEVGYDVDIEGLRKLYPPLLNFQSWLKISDWTRPEQYVPGETAKSA